MTTKNLKTTEQTAAKRRAEIAKRMEIMQAWNGSYHVLEVSAGKPIKAWPGPFRSKRAAELLLEDVVDALAKGNLDAFEGDDPVGIYEREAAFVEIIEAHDGVNDPRGLALALFKKQPWFSCDRAPTQDDDLPF